MITGKRVLLRQIERDDLPVLAVLSSNVNEFTIHQGVHLLSRQSLEERYAKGLFWGEESLWMLIAEARTRRVVGEIGCFKNAAYRTGFEIGYRIHHDADRGKGYMPEALRLFAAYLFELKPIPRLQLAIISENASSRRVAEKAGFSHEGCLRHATFVRGAYRDLEVYGLLREECPSLSSLLGESAPDVLTLAKSLGKENPS